ncbi:hypothetical protein [Tahibacter soli]|uniref:Glycosaminoglycan attachment site n=1 Tax=Tahibacter soli TaxID=2983605 RepID=A0A9X4BHG2_9GAMM|nr:hypothetical protein [Tahibacter soli]MDC8012806.1 hypothetical protein [Tahibacter soli]
MDLFQPVVPVDKQHDIFRMLMHPAHGPERAVIQGWAAGFLDRDGKFVKEFQTTFQSSFWELYMHAVLKDMGMSLDYSFHAPDFVVIAPTPFVMEATIASPPDGGAPAYGLRKPAISDDFGEFNRQAILRLCNSFTSKVRKYRQHYATLAHVRDRPYVIAIAPFDRPQAHFAANRPIMATLYGIYFDEDATIAAQAENVIMRHIEAVTKNDNANVPVGMFSDETYKDVSAVVYGPLATWGKVRALADAPERNIEFTTFHPSNAPGLKPDVRTTMKAGYAEHLLDGLYVFHNPYAEQPLPADVFDHDRLARYVVRPEGDLEERCPDDLLLMRMLISKESTFRL